VTAWRPRRCSLADPSTYILCQTRNPIKVKDSLRLALYGVLIFTGGTLIFIAVTLLAMHLAQLGGRQAAGAGLKFYIMGLAYFLLGIIVGTELWIGWSEPLRIQVPIEVHIHANNWGFMSLVFAGLLIDVLSGLTGKPLASGRTLNTIFWSMTLGALLLVIGP
jgi:putative exporter of polyketide antibiotics